jgi:nitrate/nitrite transporter NarK
VAIVLVSHSADKRRERRWHLAVPCILGGIGLVGSVAFAQNTMIALAALTLASAGIVAALAPFWSCATAFLGGTAAAGGIALINSLGNLAGFVSPYMVGHIKDFTHSTDGGIYLLAACLFAAAMLTLAALPARLVNR